MSASDPRRSAPEPPPLPPGAAVAVPGRGELFVRSAPGPDGTVPVVLVHGWQATADLNFFPLFRPLAERHPVVAADLRGHGRSLYPRVPFTIEDAADDHAALLRHLGKGPALIVGYSLGGAVAQALVARHPDVVAGVVLAATELGGRRRVHEKLYNRNGGWHGTAQRTTTGRWLADRLVSKAARENPGAEALRGWLTAEMERGHPGSMRDAGRALGAFDGAAVAATAAGAVPAVAVVTRRDRLVRPPRQERLAEVWGADVLDLDADHDAPVAQPGPFVDTMLQAVAMVGARAGARVGT